MYDFKFPDVATKSAITISDDIQFNKQSLANQINHPKRKLYSYEKDLLNGYYEYANKGFNVVLNMAEFRDKPIDYKAVDKILEDSKRINLPLNFYVTGSSVFGKELDSVPMSFSINDLKKLIDLHNYLIEKKESGLQFMEDITNPCHTWSFKEVINANANIDGFVKHIKEQNFTPFEAVTFIHQFITSQYKYKDAENDTITPRSIIGILNTNKIVCTGYAKYMKAIIDKLNMPGLECSTFVCTLSSNGEMKNLECHTGLSNSESDIGLHELNIILIKDKKYDIAGAYMSDACADSKSKSMPQGKGISHLLFPVEDLLNFRFKKFGQPLKQKDQYTRSELKECTLSVDTPIIKKLANRSKPIEYSKFKQCLKNTFAKNYPEKSAKEINVKVESILTCSKLTSCISFNDHCIGSIQKEATKYYDFNKAFER